MFMKNKIRKAFESITPNVLDSVLEDCESEANTNVNFKPKKHPPKFWNYASTAAAVLLMIGLGIGIVYLMASGGSLQQSGTHLYPPMYEKFVSALAFPFDEALDNMKLSESDMVNTNTTGGNTYLLNNKLNYAGAEFNVELHTFRMHKEDPDYYFNAFQYTSILEEDPKAASEIIHKIVANFQESYGNAYSPYPNESNSVYLPEKTALEIEELLAKMQNIKDYQTMYSAWRIVLSTDEVKKIASYIKENSGVRSKYYADDKMYLDISLVAQTNGPGNEIGLRLQYSLQGVTYGFRIHSTLPDFYEDYASAMCLPKTDALNELQIFESFLMETPQKLVYETTQKHKFYNQEFLWNVAFNSIDGVERLTESKYIGTLDDTKQAAEVALYMASDLTEIYGDSLFLTDDENNFRFTDKTLSELEEMVKSDASTLENTWLLGDLTSEASRDYFEALPDREKESSDSPNPVKLTAHLQIGRDSNTGKTVITLTIKPEVLDDRYIEKQVESMEIADFTETANEIINILGYSYDDAFAKLNLVESEMNLQSGNQYYTGRVVNVEGIDLELVLTGYSGNRTLTGFTYSAKLPDSMHSVKKIWNLRNKLANELGKKIVQTPEELANEIDSSYLNKNVWYIEIENTDEIKAYREVVQSSREDTIWEEANLMLSFMIIHGTTTTNDTISINLVYNLNFEFD